MAPDTPERKKSQRSPQPANRPAWSPIMTPCVASARLCPAPALMERPVAPSNIRVSADDPMLDAGDRLMLMINPLSPGLTIRTLTTASPFHCRDALSFRGELETRRAQTEEGCAGNGGVGRGYNRCA